MDLVVQVKRMNLEFKMELLVFSELFGIPEILRIIKITGITVKLI